MPDDLRFRSMADMPAQMPTKPATAAETRARFFNSGNAFMVVAPPVPDHSFADEPVRALDPATPTGFIVCDLSRDLDRQEPATSPFLLARYAKIRANDTLSCRFAASGAIYYVIAGSGHTDCSGETVQWGTGDVFILPGGVEHAHRAGNTDAALWLVTNEPFLALERMQPPAEGDAPTKVVHYPAAEIVRQMDVIYAAEGVDAGRAVMFSSDTQEHGRNILPTLTLAMNSLPPATRSEAIGITRSRWRWSSPVRLAIPPSTAGARRGRRSPRP